MGTNNGGKIMVRYFILLVGVFCILSSCRNDMTEQEAALKKLQALSDMGYNVTELSYRLNCSKEDVVKILQGEESVDSYLTQSIDSVYELNENEDIIPVNKLGKSASECLWNIYTKAQNLPLTSQYIDVGVSAVGNALTKRKSLEYDDSIKVLVAYINNMNNLDTIPTHINIASYYYNNNEGIENIKIPRDYSSWYKGVSSEQLIKLSYFIWQAEQFELKANENLEKSINNRITNYVANSVTDFADKDIDSYWNSLRCLFKNDKEVKDFYHEKFKERFNQAHLQHDIREEIASYCVAINCSRVLAVNEVLGYDENVDNLSIAQKIVLKKAISRMEGIQVALNQKKAELGNETMVNIALFIPLVVSQPEISVLGSGAHALNSASVLVKSWSVFSSTSTGMLAYIGFDSLYGKVYKAITGDELDSKVAIEKVQKKMTEELNFKMKQQVNQKNGYKYLLDQNTKSYYNNLRKDLGL